MNRIRKRCIVPNCTSHLEMENKVPVHRFPKDTKLKEKWIQEISTSDWTPNPKKSSRICSNHFHYKTKIGNKICITSNPNAIRKNTTETIIEDDTGQMFELQVTAINNEVINIEDDTASSLSDMDQPSTDSSVWTNLINNSKRVQKQKEKVKELRKLCIEYMETNKYLEEKLVRKNEKIAFLKSALNKLKENKMKNCKVIISPIPKRIIQRKSKKKFKFSLH